MTDPTELNGPGPASLGKSSFAAGQGDETVRAAPRTSPSVPLFGAPAAPGEIGTLGPYRLLKPLGKGGMGTVYLAVDTRLGRKLALKVMLPEFAADPEAKERFVREARAAAQISHDNVVTVYEADERDGIPYITMQFLKGSPLDVYLRAKGAPPLPHIVRIAREAAQGLAAAHALGLVHRDIKPANLWLEAPNGRVKVLDFGLAKPVGTDAEITESGAVVGTPAYMSPEQARGLKLDHRTDLFSLGAVLYRLCTGQRPFDGPNVMSVLMALGNDDPTPVRERNPAVPEALAELINHLLSKQPEARPQTATEVAKRLRAILEQLTAPGAEPPGSRATSARLSAAQPIVVHPVPVQLPLVAPMLVTEQPESAFANLDIAEDQTENSGAEPAPVREKTGRNGLLIAAGVAVLFAAVVVAGVIIIIKNKDGSETKIEVPDGASVEVKKDGKTVLQLKQDAPASEADRKAAEYTVSLGGTVRVEGQDREIRAAAELPKGALRLSLVALPGNKQVSEAGLAVFKDCKNLTYLDLNATPVTDKALEHFKGCKNLTHLDLNGTQVSDKGLAHFDGCKNITYLGLFGTKVADEGLAHFKDCKNLTHLDLNATPVTDKGLAALKDCKDLGYLWLSPAVTDEGLAVFKDCKNVTNLALFGAQVTDKGLAVFKDCKNLEHVFLLGAQVTDEGLAVLKDCKNLTRLELSGARVSGEGLAVLRDCKNIQVLGLHGTQVANAGLAHLKDCKSLTSLGLRNTKVTDEGLVHLSGLDKLTTLDLSETKVTSKGVEGLAKALPRCKITWDADVIKPKP
jgi:serine/threonine protein kinase/Leucine-rich repeat (LRR) protein